jgi:outer membrane protein OmpA-like peptidoglycan-associated protein
MRRTGALALVLALAAAVIAVPEGSSAADSALKPKVLDLVFHVQDLAANVQSMAAKIDTMVAKSRDIAVKQSRTEVKIELAADVLFDFDSAAIRPKARPSLARIATFIQGNAKGPVRILGYTDGKGAAQYNQRLSEQRAISVQRWFVDKDGLRDVAFRTQGFGARNPVAPNTKPDGSDNPGGRQKNRRVEIILRK